jgi:hypothetical protein
MAERHLAVRRITSGNRRSCVTGSPVAGVSVLFLILDSPYAQDVCLSFIEENAQVSYLWDEEN